MGRTVVAWCPDWPLTAAGIERTRPAAIVAADRVLACTVAARAAGVGRGLRRRAAQTRCPQILLVEHDPDRDATAFAPVAAAAVALAPSTELVRPGLLAVDARGPVRLYGGEEAFASILRLRLDEVSATASPACPSSRVGIADGRFAAMLAARRTDDCQRVPAEGDRSFLASMRVRALLEEIDEAPAAIVSPGPRDVRHRRIRRQGDVAPIDRTELLDLVALLEQLGVGTLGALADLPVRQVLDRFGAVGIWAHRLAGGRDERRVVAHLPAQAPRVEQTIDPPAKRSETVAFVARGLADDLLSTLARQGMRCRLVEVTALTAHAEGHTRRWRATGGFTVAALTDRVRWQLDGWLAGDGPQAPSAGVELLRLVALEVVVGGTQLTTDGDEEADDRAVEQAVLRIDGLLGAGSVRVVARLGGRDPADWAVTVPWERREQRPMAATAAPWPGRVPPPAPATVPVCPRPVELCGDDDRPLVVSGRGVLGARPTRLRIDGGAWRMIDTWGGPWPADERWWEPDGRRRARLQVVLADGEALLVAVESGRWWLEASYD